MFIADKLEASYPIELYGHLSCLSDRLKRKFYRLTFSLVRLIRLGHRLLSSFGFQICFVRILFGYKAFLHL